MNIKNSGFGRFSSRVHVYSTVDGSSFDRSSCYVYSTCCFCAFPCPLSVVGDGDATLLWSMTSSKRYISDLPQQATDSRPIITVVCKVYYAR